MAQYPNLASDQMLTVIGACTLHWSLAEAGVDALVTMVYHRFGGKAVERDIPRMLGRKVKFLRKGFQRSPLLQHMAAEAALLLGQIEELSEKRNLMIHGTPLKHGPEMIEFRWLKTEGSGQRLESHTVTHAEFQALATDTLLVGNAIAGLAKRISDWMMREHRGEPNSERPE